MIDSLRRFFDAHGIEPCSLLVACSGGPDSTALLLAMADLRAEGFEVAGGALTLPAHKFRVNHCLRGEESVGDERFVRGQCETHGPAKHVADGGLDAELVRHSGMLADRDLV